MERAPGIPHQLIVSAEQSRVDDQGSRREIRNSLKFGQNREKKNGDKFAADCHHSQPLAIRL
jgi:hypothetical protein